MLRPGTLWLSLGLLLAQGSAFAVANSVTTTLYVTRQFEVRDYDQPTKYVFNGPTRVAEITGSLSANSRVQRLRVYPGWNLCSVAVNGSWPSNGTESISDAYLWDAGALDYSHISPGQQVEAGAVVWVHAKTNAILSLVGPYSQPEPKQVPSGGAYISGAGLEVWQPTLPDAASGWEFDAPTAEWLPHLKSGLAQPSPALPPLSPGEALYVSSDVPLSLPVPNANLQIRYYHQDHLGSSCVVTVADGSVVDETAYFPFGVVRCGAEAPNTHEPYQFTQKERDSESALQYFEARYLNGPLARLLSPDAKYGDPDRLSADEFTTFRARPQQMNLYAYVENNPIKLVDPTGLGPMDSMIYYDERKAACEKMPSDERARTPSCAQFDEYEIDWDWFGRQYDKIKGKYDDVRREYCFWPAENCDIDWKATFHWGKSQVFGDDDEKDRSKPAPPPQNSGHPAGQTSTVGAPTDSQKKVIYVIANVLNAFDSSFGDQKTASPPVANPGTTKTSPAAAGASQKQPQPPAHTTFNFFSIEHEYDTASP